MTEPIPAPTKRYDAATALVVVDVQNDFGDPEGSLYVQGGEDVVAPINAEVSVALDAGATVVFTQDWHPESTPHFKKDGGIWPAHCVQDTWGAQVRPDLDVRGPVVRKGTTGEDGYSAFSVRDPSTGATAPTKLQSLLPPEVGRIVVVGLAGDWCVKETALDGRRLGYDVEMPLALTRFVNLADGDDERAIADMRGAGVEVA